jgi:hypothetical protein
MRFYGLSYWEVLNTPLVAFWGLFRNIGRIAAEEELRHFQTGIMSQARSSDAVQQFVEGLHRQIGTVFVEKPVFDSEGLSDLKALGTLR